MWFFSFCYVCFLWVCWLLGWQFGLVFLFFLYWGGWFGSLWLLRLCFLVVFDSCFWVCDVVVVFLMRVVFGGMVGCLLWVLF